MVEDLDLGNQDEYVNKKLGDGEPDDQEYEGYSGNEAGMMDVWYRRTVLLIWPPAHDFDVCIGNIDAYARQALCTIKSGRPAKEEQKITQRLLKWTSDNRSHISNQSSTTGKVLGAMCEAAIQREDPKLWTKACIAAGADFNINIITTPVIIQAAQTMGLDSLKEFLERAFKNGIIDSLRFELVDSLIVLAQNTSNKELLEWANVHRRGILYSLHSADSGVIPYLIEYARTDGCAFLMDIILPQLQKLKPSPDFWKDFMARLRAEKDSISHNTSEMDNVIQRFIIIIVEEGERLPMTSLPSRRHNKIEDLQKIALLWFGSVEEGLNALPESMNAWFVKMASEWNKLISEDKKWVAQELIPQIARLIKRYSEAHDPPIPPGDSILEPFWGLVIKGTSEYLDRDNLDVLVIGVQQCGLFDGLQSVLSTNLQKYAMRDEDYLHQLAIQAHQMAQQEAPPNPHLETLSKLVVGILATDVEIKNWHPPPSVNVSSCRDIFHTAIQCEAQDALNPLFLQIKQLTPTPPKIEEFTKFALPFIDSSVREHQSTGTLWPSEPLSTFVSDTFISLIQTLGPNLNKSVPIPQLDGFGCGCEHCLSLRTFFRNQRSTISISASQDTRKHLQRELESKASEFGFSWTTIKIGLPHTLQVAKSSSFSNGIGKMTRRELVMENLAKLGPLQVQRSIFGERWADISKKLAISESASSSATPTDQRSATEPAEENGTPASRQGPSRQATSGQGTSTSRTAKSSFAVTGGSGKKTKRSFQDADEGQASRAPPAKRSKQNQPIEIIELSD